METLLSKCDESLSYYPFFQVYKKPKYKTLESFLTSAFKQESEWILASLFVKNLELNVSPYQLLVFTNQRVIVLSKGAGGWSMLWHIVGSAFEKIPLVGFVINFLFGQVLGIISSRLKRNQKLAERLLNTDYSHFIDANKPKAKLGRGISFDKTTYKEFVQPSSGVSIRTRWLANYLGEIKATSVRFIPVVKVSEFFSSLADASKYNLPKSSVIPIIRVFLEGLNNSNIDFGFEIEGSNNELNLSFSNEFGEGTKRSSTVAASVIGFIHLFASLLVFTIDEEFVILGLLLVLISFFIIGQRKLKAALGIILVEAITALSIVMEFL